MHAKCINNNKMVGWGTFRRGIVPLLFYPIDLHACLIYNTYMTSQIGQDLTAQVLRNGYCTGSHCGGKGIANDDQTCPYNDELHPECTDLCNCCDKCAHECAMDI